MVIYIEVLGENLERYYLLIHKVSGLSGTLVFLTYWSAFFSVFQTPSTSKLYPFMGNVQYNFMKLYNLPI